MPRKKHTRQCDICFKNFTTTTGLYVHKKTIHEKIKAFKCDRCDRTFKRLHHVKDHMKLKHESKEFKCDICYLEFALERDLKKHKSAVHAKIKKYKCNFCDKQFAYTHVLAVHKKKNHLKVKDVKCEYCDEMFYFISDKNMHVKTGHLEIFDIFTCTFCNRIFKWKNYYKRHMKDFHPNHDEIKCGKCSKTFKNIDDMKLHFIQLHKTPPLNTKHQGVAPSSSFCLVFKELILLLGV